MKLVVYKDNNILRRVILRDIDDESMAHIGIHAPLPQIERIDWEAIKREVNNILVLYNVTDRYSLHGSRALEAIGNLVRRKVDEAFRPEGSRDEQTS